MDSKLEVEKNVFDSNIEEWRQAHLGEYVLIKDKKVIGFFKSLQEAFSKGTEFFGVSDFFIKQIIPKDAVNVSFYGRPLHSAS